ncbi:RNA polymerase sigma factor [Anoxybacterium hadale]|uniref:RNA polymerase sigma factor n=1 Tax=Anoxybacterium hadale TaxID=3408580 RepID=A0ACD1AGP1_9FIRM|nr:RNA polymerase sigma factor [Clostridiales bacterium]
MDDEKIIELYYARSETAIHETAQKYGTYCTRIAMNILENKEDSDECVSDAYLKTWNAIPPQRPVVFRSFLGRITRNLSLNRYKEQHRQKRGGNEVHLLLSELEGCLPSESSVESEYEMGSIAKHLDSFLYSIDTEQRILFVRRYWYVDSISSIARRFDISESKVKSTLFRIRNRLRAYLEKEGVVI